MTSYDPKAQPRIIVTTDPELDDLNSMLRLLLYSNEIDIAALVYSSSKFHHAGSAEDGIVPHRWPAPGDRMHIDIAVDAYEKAYPNLVVHDPRYPDPAELRSLVRVGNVIDVGDVGSPTPGSELVRDVLLGDAPGKIFAQAWGGTNTIARALMSVEDEFRDTDQWDDVYELITRRTVITAFAEQDSTFAEYIRPRWPELEFRDVATMGWGYFAFAVVPEEDREYLSPEWMNKNVSSVGPIGAEYRVWGDGKHMAEGFDDEDYFGVPDATEESLEQLGYRVWCPVQPTGSWLSEGDSSVFAMHIDNGLRNWEHPSFGGWGGRQIRDAADPYRWSSVGDWGRQKDGPVTDRGEVAQWFGAFQRDLGARLRWTITDSYEGANHAPRVVPQGLLDCTVSPAEEVRLNFSVEDPDGDAIDVRAWVDAGPSTATAEVRVLPDGLSVRVSPDARADDVVHVIVEALDDGEPRLAGYARYVLTVR
ncbi:DUF1593 domain-containing protein [Microbacterium sp. YY-01]|uniref:DUF1593 domain-containing protein n=1 Tax=Microbacterium sp. YY-01 TaxID=3421634 RepID=UPI003D17AAAF